MHQGPGNVMYHHPDGAPPPYTGPTPILVQPAVIQPAIIQQPTVIVAQQTVGTKPTVMICRTCGAEIITRVEYVPSMRTHLLAALLCIIGCWPCVCVPYCVESCNNINHYCPNCSSYVGSYQH